MAKTIHDGSWITSKLECEREEQRVLMDHEQLFYCEFFVEVRATYGASITDVDPREIKLLLGGLPTTIGREVGSQRGIADGLAYIGHKARRDHRLRNELAGIVIGGQSAPSQRRALRQLWQER